MSKWTKEELDQICENVVNELELSESAIAKHGPLGTPLAELVRLVLDEKDQIIRNLKAGMVDISDRQNLRRATSDKPDNVAWLLERITRMKQLLEDPHPGLFTWREHYNKIVRELVEFWEG